MRRKDVIRLWAQIVQQEGKDKYTSEEWEKYHANFWQCMQSSTQPFIKILSTEKFINNADSASDCSDDLKPLSKLQERAKTNTKELPKNPNESSDKKTETHSYTAADADQTSNIAKSLNNEAKTKSNYTVSLNHDLEDNRHVDSLIVKKSGEIHNEREKEADPGETKYCDKKDGHKKPNTRQKRQTQLKCETNLQESQLNKNSPKRPHNNQKTSGPQKRSQAHKEERNSNKKIKSRSQISIMDPAAINLKMDAAVNAETKIAAACKAAVASALAKETSNNLDNLLQSEANGKNISNQKDDTITNPMPLNLKMNVAVIAAEAKIAATCKAAVANALARETSNNAEDLFTSKLSQPKEQIKVTRNNDSTDLYFSDSSTNTELFCGFDTETDNRNENMLDDMLIDDAMAKLVPVERNVPEIINDNNNTTSVSAGAEDMNQYLENVVEETPKEILNSFNASLMTMNKTPLELEALADVLNFDLDDDDVISVTTSWNGDETLFDDNELISKQDKIQPNVQPNKTQIDCQNDIVCAGASKSQPTDLRNYRIPKQNNRTSTTPPVTAQKSSPIKKSSISKPANVQNQQQALREEQHINNLHNYEDQPQVMKALYEQQQSSVGITPTNQQKNQPQQYSTDNQEQVSNNRLETRYQQTVTESLPVFAPPFRRPLDPSFSNSIVENCQGLGKAAIFGIKCWRYINGDCNKLICCHTLNSIGEVQRLLFNMEKVDIYDTYKFMLRHRFLFANYLLSFAEIFGKRGMQTYLIKIAEDCGLYLELSPALVFDIFNIYMRFEMRPEVAAGIFMRYLWKPEEAPKYPQLTMQLLRILSCADWYNYIPILEQLFYQQRFPIPVKFLESIVLDAIAKKQQHLIDKALNLVLFYPLDRIEDVQSLLGILKNWQDSEIPGTNNLIQPQVFGQQQNQHGFA